MVLASGSFACDGNDGNDDGNTPGGTGASQTSGQPGDGSPGSGTTPGGASSMSTAGSAGDDTTTGGTQTTGQGDCDPGGCEDYCQRGRCLFDGDLDGSLCLATCTAQCGNGFFDEADQSLLSCQLAVGNDFACEDTQACCDEFFVNEICP